MDSQTAKAARVQARIGARAAAAKASLAEFESLRFAWDCVSPSTPSYRDAMEGITSVHTTGSSAAYCQTSLQLPISFVAIDFEFWEHALNGELKDKPIEIGWAVAELWLDPENEWPAEAPETNLMGWWFRGAHYCPTNMLDKVNGTYVPNNRHLFKFGQSSPPFTRTYPYATRTSIGQDVGEALYPTGTRKATQEEIVESFKAMVARLEARGPLVFVFHAAQSDIQGLESLGINASKWHKGVPLVKPLPKGSFYVDTRDYAALLLRLGDLGQGSSLKKLSKILKINDGVVDALHNAGNDAMYTLLCLVTMLAEGPLSELGDRLIADGILVAGEGGELKDNLPSDGGGRRRRGGRGRGGGASRGGGRGLSSGS